MKNFNYTITLKSHLSHTIFPVISAVSEKLNIPAYVIGGYVRDIILKRASDDIDIMVLGNGIDFAENFAMELGKDIPVKFFRNFGTAQVKFGKLKIEFVGARKESYRSNSRKPVVEEGTLEDDQKRRDFTINAMAFDLRKKTFGELIDPFNGIQDIHDRIIRTPMDPDLTFSDDPLRMMRAIRFATQLGFSIDPECFLSISRNAERIRIISPERISEELNKIIQSDQPSAGFYLMMDSGLLPIIFPEFVELKGTEVIEGVGHKDNFHHSLIVLDNVASKSDNLWLRWSAILHDIGKPSTKKYVPEIGWTFYSHDYRGSRMVTDIFRRFRLPMNEKMKYVEKLVALHLRPIVLSEEIVTDSAIRRLLFDAGDDIDDLMLLCEADITSKNLQKVKKFLDNFEVVRRKLKEIEEKDRLRNWQPPVSGEIIMQTFGIKPSKEVGIIKNAITEAILEGEIPNQFEEAFQRMLLEGERLGLKRSK
ncbi:MAG: HD domain-containing protein [Bacteroidetes bacterium]|nr:HD domain-containing protein [Bacteroidota bacterium]